MLITYISAAELGIDSLREKELNHVGNHSDFADTKQHESLFITSR